MNIGGVKINATEIDKIINACPDIKEGFCFQLKNDATADSLMALICIKQGVEVSQALNKFEQMMKKELPKVKCISGVFVVDQIPLNLNEKLMRNEAQRIIIGLKPHWFL